MRVFPLTVLSGLLVASCALPGRALRPQAADYAPERFRFHAMHFERIGRELPFVYDIVTAVKQAKSDPTTTYPAWVGLGLQAFREQFFAQSAESLKAALALSNAAPVEVRHLLARALLLDERPREAEEIWTDLVRSDPSDVEARWQLGFSLFLRDELDAAADQWVELERQRPEHPYPPFMRGLTLWSLRQFDEAQRVLIQAARATKPPPQLFVALGALCGARGDLPEASGWLRRGLEPLTPQERHRWFQHDSMKPVRASTHPTVLALVKELALDTVPAAEGGTGKVGPVLELPERMDYSTALILGRDPATLETNAPTLEEGPRMLRLAPRLDLR